MTSRNKQQNKWIAQRRDIFVKKMVREFHDTFFCFQTIYENYLPARSISFKDVETLVGSETEKGFLWRLKDRCHQLWRNEDPKTNLSGCLFDWVIGSIFHEAVKLKENIYIYQYYGPIAEEMQDRHTTATVKFCGTECRRFMERISLEMARQIENLGFMFGRANYLLRSMLPEQSHNGLLVRYLVENETVCRHLWAESLNKILAEMYGSPEEGFCVAAKSYLLGHWYEKAIQAGNKALTLNKNCPGARKIVAGQKSFLDNPPPNSATITK